MDKTQHRKLRIVTIVYWFLLLYTIAALIWWFISLEKQNREMTELKLTQLKSQPGLSTTSPAYQLLYTRFMNERRRNTTKYILEGVTFLALLSVGAAFVYRAVRKQLNLQQQQQNFMMAVTHELKTPIAVAQLNLETLMKYQLEESKRQKILQSTLKEAGRLNALANNILASAQLEGDRYKIAKDELNLSDLVKSCVQQFKSRFPDIQLEASVEPELDINGDPLLLQILVNNLLENAAKYSSGEKLMRCLLNKENKTTILQVIDQGPGIPAEEKKKIFGKFYRMGNEQTRTTSGTGLGLYLCKKIAADHNADIFVTDNTPAGSNFTVRFYT